VVPLPDVRDPEHLYLTDRHNGRVNGLYTDGHVKASLREELLLNGAVWQPAR
jgi:prepilin-type processing-associated H-X9-DG protein